MNIGGIKMRQVLAASKDGSHLEGRMFETVHDEIGMDVTLVKDSGVVNQILAVQPSYIKTGESQQLTIVGQNLTGKLSLGSDIRVHKIISRNKDRILLEAVAGANAKLGSRSIKVGGNNGGELSVYDSVGSVKMVPAFSVARVGGNGGSMPKVASVFQAEGWTLGQDGKAGTDDDQRIGYLPAKWHVEPFDESSKADNDVKFAGSMHPDSGVFTPGLAGPNPDRRMGTNNAGNLKVVAEFSEGDKTLSADGQLIVTVQRWNNPPLP